MVPDFMAAIESLAKDASILRPGKVASDCEKCGADTTLVEEVQKTGKGLGVECGWVTFNRSIDQALVVLVVVKINTDADLHRLKLGYSRSGLSFQFSRSRMRVSETAYKKG